jgi:hypothetical protein
MMCKNFALADDLCDVDCLSTDAITGLTHPLLHPLSRVMGDGSVASR